MKTVSRIAIAVAFSVTAAALAYWLGGVSAATRTEADRTPTRTPLGSATDSSGSEISPFLRREIRTRGERSFEEVLTHLRATITHSDFSDPEIAASILMLRQLSAEEIGKLIGSLDREPLAGVSPPRRETIRRLLLERWGRLDAATAIAYVSGQGVEHNRGKALGSVMGGWAKSDPVAALAYVREFDKTFPGGLMHARPATSQIYKQWALQDAEAVLASLSSEEDEFKQRVALGGIGSLLKLPDRREGIMKMIEQISDEKLRGYAVLAAISPLDHAMAADWIEAMGEFPPESRKEIREHMTNRWAQRDPRAAGEWLLKTAHDSERAKVITDVVRYWAWADTNSAAEWVAELGIGPETDGAIGRLVQGYAQIDPQAGFAWAQRITSEEERVRQLANALIYLHAAEPDAARRHLADSGIAGDEMTAVLKRLERQTSGEPLPPE